MRARHPRSRRSSARPQFLSFFRPLRIEPLEDRALLSITPQLLADINPIITQSVQVSGPIVDVGGVAFFAGNDGFTGIELWKSDGTAAGTMLVKDIRAGGGTSSSSPGSLTNVSGTLFFSASDVNGIELWKSDGTAAGTMLVKDILTGGSSNPQSLSNGNGKLFFSANDGTNGRELWTSDGTGDGTMLVKDICAGAGLGSYPRYLTNVNGALFFRATDGDLNVELWKSDGTAAGTSLVKDIRGDGGSFPVYLTNINGTLFFSANDGTHGHELWKSDGTTAGTKLVKDIRPDGDSIPFALTNFNGTLFFTANDGTNGYELWKSDGTTAGTILFKDIRGGGDSSPAFLTNVNGTLFFQANDGTTGVELWKSDGTPSGTTQVKDIRAAAGSYPASFTNVNGTLFFQANDGTTGVELWKSDGTASGTVQVRDIRAGGVTSDSSPQFLANVNGTLFFGASDGTHGTELWKSDGTAAGTVVLSRHTADSTPGSTTIVGGLAFFAANDGMHGTELWKTDGTAAGTMLVTDIHGGAGASGSDPRYLTNVNGTLYFSADDGANGRELWRTDAATGAVLVNINPTPGAGSYPGNLTNVNGTLFFSAVGGAGGYELWKSDAAAGAVLVKDINTTTGPGSHGSHPHNLANVNGTLFFSADDGTDGYELWKSDGTLNGTMLVKDINPVVINGSVTYGSDPASLTNVNGTLFFTANDGSNGYELWKSDGTLNGTILIDIRLGAFKGSNPRNFVNVNGMLFFSANDGTNGDELWRSDAAVGVVLVKNINTTAGAGSISLAPFTNVNGTLFFSANDGTTGTALWKSDGTLDGTVLVKDIRAGGDSFPRYLANVDGALFFSANDGAHGTELWKSDGTAAGTVPLADIHPGASSSLAHDLHFLAGRLIFNADDGVHGFEPWSAVLYDMGDAAASFGTTLASDGARHLSLGPQLGLLRDEEPGATASAAANGDDSSGAADEDGLVSYDLIRGKTSSVTVDVLTDGGTAKLDVWVDFDHDGSFAPLEQIIDGRTVGPGQSQITFAVPATALLGLATTRFRISTAGGLTPIGLAQDGEVEDHILTIAQDLAVNLPTNNVTDRISIRKSATSVEIFDLNASAVIASGPLAFTDSVLVNGSATEADEITVDYQTGGSFSLPGGIVLDGGASGGDLLTVTGTAGSFTTNFKYVSQGLSLGNATLETEESGVTNEIQFAGFEPLTINNANVFEVDGVLNVGSSTLTVNASYFVKLGMLTTLNNGSTIVPRGVTLTAGQVFRGRGTVTGPIAADVGSTIEATGALTMGDASSPAGFFSRGELRVFTNTVTLLDSNQVVLGSNTRLGNAGVPGTLIAANGAIIDFGGNIVGFGTLNTPNDALKPVTNNGAINGNSATEKITLAGYVKGVGSLDNVNITGTNSPGFSPATVYYGSASYGATGKLVAELGGTSGGAYDRQIYSGTADLAGTLDIELISGYQPEVGDSFTLITAAGGVHGTFGTQTLPSLPEFWSWQLAYGTNDLKTTVVTSRPWHNSRKGLDVTNDGHIAPEDPLEVINYINAFGSQALPAPHNYVAPFIDVDGDNNVSPNDALEVINAINAGLGGEGEGSGFGVQGSGFGVQGSGQRGRGTGFDELTELLAFDVASQPKRR